MDDVEMTLRALTDGADLQRAPLPPPVRLSAADAAQIAVWCRPFAGVCLMDLDIHVGDIRPSTGAKVLADLPPDLAAKVRKSFAAAETHGFGLRLSRETTDDPYTLEIVRRVIDPVQLTIPRRSMGNFMKALGLIHDAGDDQDRRTNVDAFAGTLARRAKDCMDAGVGHYHQYAMRIVAFARANGATELTWGRERRGSVGV